MKFATVRVGDEQLYGAIVDGGFIALSDAFHQWPTLRDVIEAGALPDLIIAAEQKEVSHPNGSFTYDLPIPNAARIEGIPATVVVRAPSRAGIPRLRPLSGLVALLAPVVVDGVQRMRAGVKVDAKPWTPPEIDSEAGTGA